MSHNKENVRLRGAVCLCGKRAHWRGSKRCDECLQAFRASKPTPRRLCSNLIVIDCLMCERAFVKRNARKCCSELCSMKREQQRGLLKYTQAKQKQGDGRTPATYRRAADRRRVLLRNAWIEDVTVGSLASRDGWVCRLCGSEINTSLSWPDPYSATIDHVMPLSVGGLHSLSNTQLAHFRCNIRKSNGHSSGQLRQP